MVKGGGVGRECRAGVGRGSRAEVGSREWGRQAVGGQGLGEARNEGHTQVGENVSGDRHRHGGVWQGAALPWETKGRGARG